jgi:hypothetical protein
MAFASLKTSKVGTTSWSRSQSRKWACNYPRGILDLVPRTPVGKVDRKAWWKNRRKTAVWITIIPVARGLQQALTAVRDCAATARFCV